MPQAAMSRRSLLSASLLIVLAAPPGAAPSDWPRFRGPNGTGVSEDAGLPDEVGPDNNVLWAARLPKGSSSPWSPGDRSS